MKKKLLALAALAPLGMAAAASGQVVINEFDSDTFNTPATDYREFIELFSPTGTTTSLEGLTVALFNGNGDTAYAVLPLTGTTNSSGYYLIGSTSVPGANNTSLLGAGNILQNGADAIAIYSGAFAVGGAATTANLVDAVVYGTADPIDPDLLAALGETVQYDEGAATPPSDELNLTLGRLPNGTGEFVQQIPTPGAVNVPEPASLSLLGLGGLLLVRRRA